MSSALALFLQLGGFASWLFLVGLIPQVWTNIVRKRYTSGSLGTWGLYIVAYYVFGAYMFAVGQVWVGVGQLIGGTLCVVIVLQSQLLPHAR